VLASTGDPHILSPFFFHFIVNFEKRSDLDFVDTNFSVG